MGEMCRSLLNSVCFVCFRDYAESTPSVPKTSEWRRQSVPVIPVSWFFQLRAHDFRPGSALSMWTKKVPVVTPSEYRMEPFVQTLRQICSCYSAGKHPDLPPGPMTAHDVRHIVKTLRVPKVIFNTEKYLQVLRLLANQKRMYFIYWGSDLESNYLLLFKALTSPHRKQGYR